MAQFSCENAVLRTALHTQCTNILNVKKILEDVFSMVNCV